MQIETWKTLDNKCFATEVHSTIYSNICKLIPNLMSNLLHYFTIRKYSICKVTKIHTKISKENYEI